MNLIEITDLTAPETALFAIRSETQLYHINEPHPGYFIAESPNVVERAMHGGYEIISILIEKSQLSQLAQLEIPEETPIYTAEEEVLRSITGMAMTRGVLALMRRRSLPDLKELLAGKQRIAVLEDVMNPTNLGAIFRSAAALGIEAVLLAGGCSDPLYRRAARVSMGTVFQVPWTKVDRDWIQVLHDAGFQLAAMALEEDSIRVNDPLLKQAEKLAIVLGTEGTGLKPETIASSDHTVMIPMTNGVDSLNVAAASAVVFYALALEQ